MGWFSKNKQKSIQGYAEQDNSGAWLSYISQYVSSLGNEKLIKFSGQKAYELACNVAEIFIPIDAIADRASSISYDLVYEDTGKEYIAKGNLKRLIENPNPFDRFSDIVYKSVFSELSDGNSYLYTKTPDAIKNPTIDNISNIWELIPNKTTPVLLKEISNPFLIKDKSELIKSYDTFFFYQHEIEPRYILHRTALGINSFGKGISPLTRVEKNINNILAVYQARYNVYAKNGNAGILSRDVSQTNSLTEAVDPVTRDAILKDLQNRNGLTGDKNLMGISSIPLRYIKTLGTIAELQPFEETESNAITIAGIFGVDAELIPKKGSSTFTNKEGAERGLWQNVIKSICEDKASDLTKAFYLPDGVVFKPNFSKVEALQEDKKVALESDSLFINNLSLLEEKGIDVTENYNKIKTKYDAY